MLLLLTLHTLSLLSFFPLLHSFLTSPPSIPPSTNLLLPSDAVALLSFKSKADLDHKLLFDLNERFDYCQWQGVKCAQGRVVRFVLQGFGLRGLFSPNTLTRLDQLRVLSLRNNSLWGPIPDLSGLPNLKSLILNRNNFSGSFPPSIFLLHRLRVLDLSFNNFSGPIPVDITHLDRLNSLRLEVNRFDGTLPPLNQSLLLIFNVSGNNLTGPIPVTTTLSRFGASSFVWNFGLCGEIVNRACSSHDPFFDSSNASSPQSHPMTQSAQSQGVVLTPPASKKHKKTSLILGVSIAVSMIVAALLCLLAVARTRSSQRPTKQKMASPESVGRYPNTTTTTSMATITNQVREIPTKVKIDEQVHQRVHGSGNLVFCVGETHLYTLEQLMRASAELLGRGTMGITYKAVLDNHLIVTVKRLDAGRTAVTSSEVFERHMDAVGVLRHPNLVPVRAYFQAKGERLVIYDYQPNGSLFNLIHGRLKLNSVFLL